MTIPAGPGHEGPAWHPAELVSALLSKSAGDVVRFWISNTEFLGADNHPQLLSFADSECCDFSGLVLQVNCRLAPAIIRSELLQKGIVEQHDDGSLLLRRSAYVPGTCASAACFSDDQALAADERLVAGEVFRRRRNDIF